jgi:hypothetical protein
MSGCPDATTDWRFTTDEAAQPPSYGSDVYNAIRSADNPWNEWRSYTGASPVDISYNSSAGQVRMLFFSTPGAAHATGLTVLSCIGADYLKIWSDTAHVSSIQGVTTHEFGHVLGLSHAHPADYQMTGENQSPTMWGSGCHDGAIYPGPLSATASLSSLEIDDWAALEERFDDDMLNGNPGFEWGDGGAYSTQGWRKSGGAMSVSTTARSGSRGLLFSPSGVAGLYVYSRMRIWDGGNYAQGLFGSADVRDRSSAQAGYVYVKIRGSWTGTGSPNDCSYPTNLALTLRSTRQVYPTTSWTWTRTDTWYGKGVDGTGRWDVQVDVWDYTYIQGNYTYDIYVDNARIGQ